MKGPVWYQRVTMQGASRTDARGQGGVHVDYSGCLGAADAQTSKLVSEQEPELLQYRQRRQLEKEIYSTLTYSLGL